MDAVHAAITRGEGIGVGLRAIPAVLDDDDDDDDDDNGDDDDDEVTAEFAFRDDAAAADDDDDDDVIADDEEEDKGCKAGTGRRCPVRLSLGFTFFATNGGC